jgi:hypothetical protein
MILLVALHKVAEPRKVTEYIMGDRALRARGANERQWAGFQAGRDQWLRIVLRGWSGAQATTGAP